MMIYLLYITFPSTLEKAVNSEISYDIKFLLGDFNVKVGSENIFKPTVENESLHESSNDDGVRVVNSVTSKNLVVKKQCFLIVKFINTPGPLLRERHTTRLITF
jgi:hypothetical protein